MTSDLTLYHTLGCHLCEQAEALIDPVLSARSLSWELVDIADDDVLLEQYGMRIPVLKRRCDGAELGWPFDAASLTAWLAARCE